MNPVEALDVCGDCKCLPLSATEVAAFHLTTVSAAEPLKKTGKMLSLAGTRNDGAALGGRGDVTAHADPSVCANLSSSSADPKRPLSIDNQVDAVYDTLPFIDDVSETDINNCVDHKTWAGTTSTHPLVATTTGLFRSVAESVSTVPAILGTKHGQRGCEQDSSPQTESRSCAVNDNSWFEVYLSGGGPLTKELMSAQTRADPAAGEHKAPNVSSANHPLSKTKPTGPPPSGRHPLLSMMSPMRWSRSKDLPVLSLHHSTPFHRQPVHSSGPDQVTKSQSKAAETHTSVSLNVKERARTLSFGGIFLTPTFSKNQDPSGNAKVSQPSPDRDRKEEPSPKTSKHDKRLRSMVWIVGGQRNHRLESGTRGSWTTLTEGHRNVGQQPQCSPLQSRVKDDLMKELQVAINRRGGPCGSTPSTPDQRGAVTDDPDQTGTSDSSFRSILTFRPATETLQATARYMAHSARQAQKRLAVRFLSLTMCGLLDQSRRATVARLNSAPGRLGRC